MDECSPGGMPGPRVLGRRTHGVSSAESMTIENNAVGLKAKAIAELMVFCVVAGFLALMFGAFTAYRRLILTEFGIAYVHYGAGLVEALIVAFLPCFAFWETNRALGEGKLFAPLFPDRTA